MNITLFRLMALNTIIAFSGILAVRANEPQAAAVPELATIAAAQSVPTTPKLGTPEWIAQELEHSFSRLDSFVSAMHAHMYAHSGNKLVELFSAFGGIVDGLKEQMRRPTSNEVIIRFSAFTKQLLELFINEEEFTKTTLTNSFKLIEEFDSWLQVSSCDDEMVRRSGDSLSALRTFNTELKKVMVSRNLPRAGIITRVVNYIADNPVKSAVGAVTAAFGLWYGLRKYNEHYTVDRKQLALDLNEFFADHHNRLGLEHLPIENEKEFSYSNYLNEAEEEVIREARKHEETSYLSYIADACLYVFHGDATKHEAREAAEKLLRKIDLTKKNGVFGDFDALDAQEKNIVRRAKKIAAQQATANFIPTSAPMALHELTPEQAIKLRNAVDAYKALNDEIKQVVESGMKHACVDRKNYKEIKAVEKALIKELVKSKPQAWQDEYHAACKNIAQVLNELDEQTHTNGVFHETTELEPQLKETLGMVNLAQKHTADAVPATQAQRLEAAHTDLAELRTKLEKAKQAHRSSKDKLSKKELEKLKAKISEISTMLSRSGESINTPKLREKLIKEIEALLNGKGRIVVDDLTVEFEREEAESTERELHKSISSKLTSLANDFPQDKVFKMLSDELTYNYEIQLDKPLPQELISKITKTQTEAKKITDKTSNGFKAGIRIDDTVTQLQGLSYEMRELESDEEDTKEQEQNESSWRNPTSWFSSTPQKTVPKAPVIVITDTTYNDATVKRALHTQGITVSKIEKEYDGTRILYLHNEIKGDKTPEQVVQTLKAGVQLGMKITLGGIKPLSSDNKVIRVFDNSASREGAKAAEDTHTILGKLGYSIEKISNITNKTFSDDQLPAVARPNIKVHAHELANLLVTVIRKLGKPTKEIQIALSFFAELASVGLLDEISCQNLQLKHTKENRFTCEELKKHVATLRKIRSGCKVLLDGKEENFRGLNKLFEEISHNQLPPVVKLYVKDHAQALARLLVTVRKKLEKSKTDEFSQLRDEIGKALPLFAELASVGLLDEISCQKLELERTKKDTYTCDELKKHIETLRKIRSGCTVHVDGKEVNFQGLNKLFAKIDSPKNREEFVRSLQKSVNAKELIKQVREGKLDSSVAYSALIRMAEKLDGRINNNPRYEIDLTDAHRELQKKVRLLEGLHSLLLEKEELLNVACKRKEPLNRSKEEFKNFQNRDLVNEIEKIFTETAELIDGTLTGKIEPAKQQAQIRELNNQISSAFNEQKKSGLTLNKFKEDLTHACVTHFKGQLSDLHTNLKTTLTSKTSFIGSGQECLEAFKTLVDKETGHDVASFYDQLLELLRQLSTDPTQPVDGTEIIVTMNKLAAGKLKIKQLKKIDPTQIAAVLSECFRFNNELTHAMSDKLKTSLADTTLALEHRRTITDLWLRGIDNERLRTTVQDTWLAKKAITDTIDTNGAAYDSFVAEVKNDDNLIMSEELQALRSTLRIYSGNTVSNMMGSNAIKGFERNFRTLSTQLENIKKQNQKRIPGLTPEQDVCQTAHNIMRAIKEACSN